MPLASKIPSDMPEDSGIMWGAIIGGAFGAAGLTIILAPIGAAFGVAAMQPWHSFAADRDFTIASAIWIVIVQWLASGLGGYLTGRLRTEWVGAHTHEVFFRDTVHGFLSWALVTIAANAILAVTALQTMAAQGTPAHQIKPTAFFLYALSLLIGAFIAALAGALGGHDRDRHYATGRFSD